MPDNQMDELFNERLRDHRSSVPADMWDRIIQKKKKDRNLFIFFFKLFGLLILTLGLAGEYSIFQHGKKETEAGHALHSNLNSIQALSLPNAVSEAKSRKYQRKKSSERSADNFEQARVSTKSKTA